MAEYSKTVEVVTEVRRIQGKYTEQTQSFKGIGTIAQESGHLELWSSTDRVAVFAPGAWLLVRRVSDGD